MSNQAKDEPTSSLDNWQQRHELTQTERNKLGLNMTHPNPDTQSNEDKQRNTQYWNELGEGTMFAGMGDALKDIPAPKNWQPEPSPTQSDKTAEALAFDLWAKYGRPGTMKEFTDEAIAALTAREERLLAERDAQWQSAINVSIAETLKEFEHTLTPIKYDSGKESP